ncbi:MAG: beta-glucuronidase [Paludibacter sp.]|nr:beta-glucuronidase [Paludibacter sp.]
MKKLALVFITLFAFSVQLFISGENTINLKGKWSFAMDEKDQGITQKWFTQRLKDSINLPGSMVENLKGDDITLETKFTASIYDSSWYFNPYMAKYRQPGNLKMPFWLTQLKHYTGLAWYQTEVHIPASWTGTHMTLNLERPHFITRLWIDDNQAGTQNSLTVPHVFDLTNLLTPGKHIITIRIDNRLKSMDVGTNSHSVTDQTQGNWNGIVGDMLLKSGSLQYINDVQVFPDLKHKIALVKIQIMNLDNKTVSGKISLAAKSFNSDKTHIVPPLEVPVSLSTKETNLEIKMPMGDGMLTWDEFAPALYNLTATLTAENQLNSRSVEFGMREITIQGKYFYINGNKTVLRGTVENCVFPLTGYAPMDEPSWERVFRICKSYGLNHMRFHSYCPPEAAFKAADRIGFYLQPEGPSWPNHSTQLGRGLSIDTYLMDETKRMVKEYGNYASFTFMAAGNEPRGAWVPWVGKFVDYWKATDSRRLYTGASVGNGWAWQPKSQYHVKAGARGLSWSNVRPETMSDYRSKIDTVKQPYVSHETGQWCAFPNFEEIKKYTGVTRAKNFELFQEDLADHDMADLSHDFLIASGKLQALCYKHEIERTLRTPDYAGFQLLSLNDYSGQGTAMVGVLDAFWDEKGYTTAPAFRRFCNSTVPLIRTEKFVYKNSETLIAKVEVAHFGKAPITNTKTLWRIQNEAGTILKQGVVSEKDIPVGTDFELGVLNLNLSEFKTPMKLNLEIAIEGTGFVNDWNFWVYPDHKQEVNTTGIYITSTLDTKAINQLNQGQNVLLLAAGHIQYGKDVSQFYSPVFWNTSWFKMRPPHTTGMLVNNTHPVFKDFVTDSWGDMQWWELINHAQTMLLTDFPKGFKPIVQPIDTWFQNRKLGMLFETNVGKGKLIMTSIDLQSDLANRPVASQLYQSIINYMQSDKFHPSVTVEMNTIRDLYEKKSAVINTYTKSNPDELKKDVK